LKPLAIDLYCGLGGWSEGLLAHGYDVTGYDIQAHEYGDARYPGTLVLRDVLTIHGAEFADAALIVASPPCQNYSYLAMPWSRSKDPENSKAAKALRRKWETDGPDNRLFDACFRIQREASAAAGRHVPLVVENVRGAQPWVGRAKANYGSFYLWGDVEQIGNRIQAGADIGRFGRGLRVIRDRAKNDGGSWFAVAHNTTSGHSQNPVTGEGQKTQGRNFHTWALTGGAVTSPSFHGAAHETRGVGLGHKGTKVSGDWFGNYAEMKAAGTISPTRTTGKHTQARAAASARIAKIPPPLSEYVAQAHQTGADNRSVGIHAVARACA
jgi:hypothetical protein